MKTFVVLFSFLICCGCNRNIIAKTDPEDLPKPIISLLDLKKKHIQEGAFTPIEEDVSVSGIIIANDIQGNLYKQIIIQDESGALPVLIDGYAQLYSEFPMGFRLLIQCKNLTLNDYRGNIRLGYAPNIRSHRQDTILAGIPRLVLNEHILKKTPDRMPAPQTVRIAQILENTKIISKEKMYARLQNQLIRIEGIQFKNTAATFADPKRKRFSVGHTLSDCQGAEINLRNSSFATFSAQILPKGNGSFTGYYTLFNNDVSLYIRSLQDIQFNEKRCAVIETKQE